MFQPVHGFAIESFGDGDVGEGGGGGGAVPVFFAGREPDDVAGVDGFHGAAEALDAAGTGGDDEGLAEGMGVPGGTGAGFEGDDGAADARGVAAFEGGVDADGAGEPVGGTFGGGLGAVAFDFHGVSLVWVGRIVYRPELVEPRMDPNHAKAFGQSSRELVGADRFDQDDHWEDLF